jgi:hypothetical protein
LSCEENSALFLDDELISIEQEPALYGFWSIAGESAITGITEVIVNQTYRFVNTKNKV